MKKHKPKLIVVLGPTASGKTNLSIKLAKKFNGEVISADSRQVYKGMNIGTGKVTKREMQGIPHHLLDIASPKTKFTVAKYQKLASKSIEKIIKQGKTPILCGGTGFYIQTVIDGIVIPKVKPDWKLRKKLEKKSAQKLFETLKRKDPKRAELIDKYNKRRLIRALEIVTKTKKPVPLFKKEPPNFQVLILGIKKSPNELKKLIKKRLLKRLKIGMVAEVKKLKKSGISWRRLEEFGLEYRYVAQYLQSKLTKAEMIERLTKKIEHYAKKQMTWFIRQNFAPQSSGGSKKYKLIDWIKNYQEAEKLVKIFLKK